MAERTALSLELKADDFIDSLDKSAAKAEDFGDRCSKAMSTIDKNVDKMTKSQQRSYEGLKAAYDKNVKAIKDMESEYERLRAKRKAGDALTDEEVAKLKELKVEYGKASRAIANTAKEMEGLISRNKDLKDSMKEGAKASSDFADVVKIAFGNVMATALTEAISLAKDLVSQFVELGLKAQQTVAQLGAMKNNIMGGAEAYELFNNVLRNTNWQEDTVMNMGKQLMNLGYNAKEASDFIQILADTSAGLGTGESGASTLLSTLNKLKSTSEFSAKEMKRLQEEGIHAEEAFAKAFGVSVPEVMAKIKEGAVDGQQAFEILTNYMETEFKGSMDASKQNVTDAWGDIMGNITTIMGDIGKAIFDGFNQTGILQELVQGTNELVDSIRLNIQIIKAEYAPAFEFLGNIAKGAFAVLNAGLNLAIATFKVAYEALQPFIKALMEIFDWCNKVFDAIGDLWKRIGKSWDAAVASSNNGEYEGDYGLDTGLVEDEKKSVSGYKGAGAYEFNATKTDTSSSQKDAIEAQKKAREDLNNSLNGTRQAYADIVEKLKETRKGEDDLTKASNEYTNADLQGLALIKEQNKQRLAQMDVQKAREKEDHEARMKMLTELKDKLQAAMDDGLIDGTDTRLTQIQAQIDKETELHNIRIGNIDALKKKTEELNDQRVKKEAESTNAVRSYYDSLARNFSSSMAQCILEAKSFGDAFKEIIKQIIQQLIQALFYAILVSSFSGAGGFANFGKNFGRGFFGAGYKADGGLVLGAGTGTSDSIPTMLSNGEYVINAEATKHNLPLLNAINAGYNPVAHMAEGGLVGAAGGAGGGTVVLNVSALDASSFADFLSSGGLKTIKQAFFDDSRNFNASFDVF